MLATEKKQQRHNKENKHKVSYFLLLFDLALALVRMLLNPGARENVVFRRGSGVSGIVSSEFPTIIKESKLVNESLYEDW